MCELHLLKSCDHAWHCIMIYLMLSCNEFAQTKLVGTLISIARGMSPETSREDLALLHVSCTGIFMLWSWSTRWSSSVLPQHCFSVPCLATTQLCESNIIRLWLPQGGPDFSQIAVQNFNTPLLHAATPSPANSLKDTWPRSILFYTAVSCRQAIAWCHSHCSDQQKRWCWGWDVLQLPKPYHNVHHPAVRIRYAPQSSEPAARTGVVRKYLLWTDHISADNDMNDLYSACLILLFTNTCVGSHW